MSSLYDTTYNPDVLSCIANLSNDEVFTPPQVVNRMLDMLPAELFRSKETKFPDPVSKSGVFLREIAISSHRAESASCNKEHAGNRRHGVDQEYAGERCTVDDRVEHKHQGGNWQRQLVNSRRQAYH